MDKHDPTDEWLMGQVALGKRDLLAPLVRRYANPLLTYLERMVADRHRAEELFQEVFLAVWLKRRTYKFPRPFKPWLFAIATNRCRTEFRRVRRSATLEPMPPLAGPDDSPDDSAIATETAAIVQAAVTRLPAKQRTVLVLRIWNGLSYAEIARAAGCSEGTARTHMHQALAAMRRYLEPRLRERA